MTKQKRGHNSSSRSFQKLCGSDLEQKFRRAFVFYLKHKTGHNSSSRPFQELCSTDLEWKFRRASFSPQIQNRSRLDQGLIKALPVGLPFYGGAPSWTTILWKRSQLDYHSMEALPVGIRRCAFINEVAPSSTRLRLHQRGCAWAST